MKFRFGEDRAASQQLSRERFEVLDTSERSRAGQVGAVGRFQRLLGEDRCVWEAMIESVGSNRLRGISAR